MAIIKPEQLRSGFYNITGSLYGTSSFAYTASHVDNAVVTASAVNDTITFTKGNGTTFPVTLTSIATASYALNALSSSYAATASYINTLYSSNYTQSFTNQSTWVVIHNLDTRYVIVQVYDTAFDEIIPQNIDLTNDDTVTITFPTLESGTAVVSVGGALHNSGTISSSYAFSSTSASFALTASYFSGSITNAVSAISASYALTASYVQNTISASYASTASYVTLAQTASYINPTFISASAAAAGFGSGGGSVTVPGSDTQILFNSASALGASPDFRYNHTIASFQHGYNTTASIDYSHAEGYQALASGYASHAEGDTTTTLGAYSHAEGSETKATAIGSHAEGQNTIAEGVSSHAEGYFTSASGAWSHAEGFQTKAKGTFSHAEGLTNISSGSYSHAEGTGTISIGENSHAEGQQTLSQGGSSHAEGVGSVSFGDFSHAEGDSNESRGYASHAEGFATIALGNHSHTEGRFTIASGSYQHVQGQFNTHGDSTSLMIVGNGTNSARRDAFKVRMSGSIVLPTTQSAAPLWIGTDGEIVPATVGGQYFLYMWMNGAWRSGSFV